MVGLPAAPILSWTILLAPLCAAVLVLLCGIHRPRLSASLAIAGLLLSFLCTGRLFLHAVGHPGALPFETSVDWMATPGALSVSVDRTRFSVASCCSLTTESLTPRLRAMARSSSAVSGSRGS